MKPRGAYPTSREARAVVDETGERRTDWIGRDCARRRVSRRERAKRIAVRVAREVAAITSYRGEW